MIETDPAHKDCPLYYECLDCGGVGAGEDHAPDAMCRNRDERCTCKKEYP